MKATAKTGILTAIISLSSLLTSAVYADQLPCWQGVGGSEHSVGVPGPGTFADAREAFASSPAVQARIALLERHGFCATSYTPSVTLVSPSCADSADSFCFETYKVSSNYTRGRRQVRDVSVSGRFVVSNGLKSRFESDPIDISGIGRVVRYAANDSEVLLNALADSNIVDESGVMGMQTLFVGQILCSQPVVMNPVPHCTLISGDQVIEATESSAFTINRFLIALRAQVGPKHVVGAFNTGAALVTCKRGVYPGAQAACSLVVEN